MIEGRVYLETAGDRGQRAVVCALEPRPGQTNYLMPARLIKDDGESKTWSPSSSWSIEAQTLSLQSKIRAIDNLHLSEVCFDERIAAARMYISAPSEDTAWELAREAMSELPDQLNLVVTSQIDYDQKLLHPTLGSVLENIDFAIRHDPSAIATTVAYEKLLQESGLALSDAVIAVTGVGDLGSRIVKQFLADDVGRVLVADEIAERRSEMALLSRVEEVSVSEVASAACHAQVLAANKSFTDDVGALWAAEPAVVVVGGPEAGLDRFVKTRRLLAEAGKEYVPSVLCGSLGLVSNLEEFLGIAPDLSKMTVRYSDLIDSLIADMQRTGASFSEACEAMLSGTASVGD
jgi:hypothetical protein